MERRYKRGATEITALFLSYSIFNKVDSVPECGPDMSIINKLRGKG